MADEIVTKDHFPQIIEALHKAAAQAVRKTAGDIQAVAGVNAPVGETGFLHNSIYVVTSDSNDYGGGDKSLPEVPAPDDEYTALVAVAANYGVYVEFGTRFMGARPYITPAVERVRPSFEAAMEAIDNKLKEAGVE